MIATQLEEIVRGSKLETIRVLAIVILRITSELLDESTTERKPNL